MKILIVNTSDIQGGAARAAYRFHQALLAQGIESEMLVQRKSSDDFSVIPFAESKIDKGMVLLYSTLDAMPLEFYKEKTKTLFSPAWFGFSSIIDKINEINPDIVHLHWINGGMLKIEELSKIESPIVWTLHDMWAFTGGCHYDEGCGAFIDKCGKCKVLGSSKEKDLSRKVFARKQKTFDTITNMTIVGLSKWLSDAAKSSTLLKNKKHINLPNPIDTEKFKPFEKLKARELWNLPKEKKLVLFGAIGAASDPRKGFDELSDAMKQLVSSEIEFVVFGSSEPKNSPDFGFKTHYLGSLHDDVSLVTLYSAVDVMVVPSLQENLSNAIMESLSCGTPIVGFNIGGNSDMIEHKRNGYLAKPFDVIDLAKGIEYIVYNDHYVALCENARQKIVNEFDSRIVSQKYINLYKEIINDNK